MTIIDVVTSFLFIVFIDQNIFAHPKSSMVAWYLFKRKFINTWGTPEYIRLDTGLGSTSAKGREKEFIKKAKQEGIKVFNRIRSRPQSLGLAEKVNEHIGKIREEMQIQGLNMVGQDRADLIAKEWNRETKAASGLSPAELLIGQNIRGDGIRGVIEKADVNDLVALRKEALACRRAGARKAANRTYVKQGKHLLPLIGDTVYIMLTGADWTKRRIENSKSYINWIGPAVVSHITRHECTAVLENGKVLTRPITHTRVVFLKK